MAILQVTDEEIANKKVQIQTDYDTKEVTVNGETELLYKRELTNELVVENEESTNIEITTSETPTQKEDTTKNNENTENQDVIITGYMPLDAKAEIKEIDLVELTKVKIPNENQTMQMAYEVSVMENMFKDCGTIAMTTLNLGPAFTRVVSTNFMENCGTSALVIYAPESICLNDSEFYVQD